MQVVIDSIKHYILSRDFNTRQVTVEKNTGATADYPEGLLLAVDTSNNKMKVAENADTAVCALLNRIPKASIKANDVKAEVVYISGLAKPKIIDSTMRLVVGHRDKETTDIYTHLNMENMKQLADTTNREFADIIEAEAEMKGRGKEKKAE